MYQTNISSLASSIAAGDINGDDRMDLVVAYPDEDQVLVLFSDGTGSFIEQIILSTEPGSYPSFVTVHDINNDTQSDIIIANRYGHNIGVFLGSRNGSYLQSLFFSTSFESSPIVVVLADFNGDNLTDLAVGNDADDDVNILLQVC